MNFRAWTDVDNEFDRTDDGFAFHKISFQWYSTIGVFLTWIPALIVSHLTGGQNLDQFNIRLLAPCIQKLLPIKYHHVELVTTKERISVTKRNNIPMKHEPFELVELKNTKTNSLNQNGN